MLRTIVVFLLATILGACSFQPIYGDKNLAQASSIAFNYAAPNSREEQIVYQTLALSFPHSESAPHLKVFVAAWGGADFKSAGRGSTTTSVSVTATATVAGKQVFRVNRAAEAQYTYISQTLNTLSARIDARERAAKSAAESIRLAILAQNYL